MDYFTGFGNHFESEALAGSLPQGQNSPKKPLMGLVPEQLTGSAFTMERHQNLRSWLYRIHPSTFHGPYEKFTQSTWKTKVVDAGATPPSQFRWQPLNNPQQDCDFIEGVKTMVNTETPGCSVHHYHCNKAMGERYFYNADAEMIILPEKGSLEVKTEMGPLQVEPQEIVVIPRGIKFQVNPMQSGWTRGYLGENFGSPFILPNLGPL